MKESRCEICSQRVAISGDSYGSHFYLPMERSAMLQEVAELLRHLSTDPKIQILTVTDALIHASKAIMVDR